MRIKYISVILLSFLLLGCIQLQELNRFAQCKFDFDSINNIKLANINIENISNYNDLGFTGIATLVSGFASGNLPLTLDLDLSVKNPNSQKASINALDWIAIIDDIEVATGSVKRRIEVPANNIPAKITLPVSVNLVQLLKGENQSKVLNFGMNLTGHGNQPSRVKVKIKPSINVAGQTIQSPAYITLTKDI